jgi:hypothetical protein
VPARPAHPPQDFEWSPAEPLLAAYTQEVGDRPANISIIRIPERSAVRSKQLFNVSDTKIFWHPQVCCARDARSERAARVRPGRPLHDTRLRCAAPCLS